MVAKGDRVAIATVVDTRRSAPRPLGSRLAVSSAGEMVGSVSGGCVESDVYLRAEEVLAGGPPQLLQYGISDDDAFDVGLPCGGEIEVFVQLARPRGARPDRRGRRARRAAVGHHDAERRLRRRQGLRRGRGPLERRPHRRDHVRRALRPAAGGDDLRRRRHRPGAVPDGEAGRLHDDRLGRARQVRDARAAAGRRRADRRLAGDGLRRARRSTTPPTSSSSPTTPASTSPRWARRCAPTRPTSARSGSRRAQATRRERLLNAGYTDDEIGRIRGPLGLDIGAVTPAETAVSILAEILAVRSGREGGPLSLKSGRITVPG